MPNNAPPKSPHDAYLERHSALLVTNSRLRFLILGLVALLAVLAFGYTSVARSFASLKPMVIRIDSVGRAQAVNYSATEYKVQEAEIKYFLIDFIKTHYGRLRGSARDDIAHSLYFVSQAISSQTLAELKATHSLDDFISGSSNEIEITVNQISLEDLRQQPYKATISYDKTYYSPMDHSLISRSSFTVSLQFIVLDKVPARLMPVNPLGLTVIYLHEDQAITNVPIAAQATN